jgi:LmbE family N-acetylglucosaminyl deacetylase
MTTSIDSAIIDPVTLGTAVTIWAHPDDETYLAGGLMAALRDAGQRVVVVTATRGEDGLGPATATERSAAAAVRSAELGEALRTLGVVEHHWLDYADGACADVDAADPVARLVRIIDRVRPAIVISFGPDGFTGHPDHIAVAGWVAQACTSAAVRPRLWQPVVTAGRRDRHRDIEDRFGVFALGVPRICTEAELSGRLRLSGAALGRKVRALRGHASQTTGLIAAMGEDRYAEWVSVETFVDATCEDSHL